MPAFELYTDDIKQDMDSVDNYIKRALKTHQRLLSDVINQLAGSGGKRLRPLMVILSSRFGGYKRDEIIHLAAAIEILHMATLVHDDIIDDAPIRRGEPTVQSRWGKDVAVFTGDFLFSTVFSLLSKEVSFDDLYEVSRVVKQICEGEVDQYQHRYNTAVSVRSYLRRIRHKTADLFALSCVIGAKRAGCSKPIYNALENFGMDFGMVFQIIDDILDFEGQQEELGKPAGADFEEGVYTLPLIYALDTKYRLPLLDVLNKDRYDASDVEAVKAMVKAAGGIEKARSIANNFAAKAVEDIKLLPDNEHKRIMLAILDESVKRRY
ncbi:MAG: hypothetical protein PWP48_5 [Clostridiales bacterium]|jgi:heptaprenyl diphosphate synthase|nr:hypothetical protein [Clostridiales bacterium]MDK2990772.1 hypothetical protein [Clostridiales bacterium]